MQLYTVKSGDTLISIARQSMGTGDAWRLIAQLNGLGDPGQLRVGQSLQIPITEYVVKTGDSLRRIAREQLQTEAAWQNIAILNNISDPRFLVVGQVLKLPLPVTTQPIANSGTGETETLGRPSPSQGNPESSSGSTERSYVVQRGDSLIAIAQKTLGDRSRWRELALRNNITDPADLKVGTRLKLPPNQAALPTPAATIQRPTPIASTVTPETPITPVSPAAPPETPARQSLSWDYTVVRGDTLIGIARKTLNDGNRWTEIAELNNIYSPSDLRVDQVLRIPGSRPVGSSTEMPVAPAPAPQPESSQPEPTPSRPTYVVQRGDTLISIARKTLGQGDRWREIALLNNISNTRDLRVGIVLKLPQANGSSPVTTPVIPAPSEYTVKRGDTLTSIAREVLGDGDRWKEIANLNRIKSPSALRVGMVLKLPIDISTVHDASDVSPAPTPLPPTPIVQDPSAPESQSSQPPSPPPPTTYVVQSGDTLYAIAEKTLGDRSRWDEIGRLNNLADPGNLTVGSQLLIPTAEGSPVPLMIAPALNETQGKASSKLQPIKFSTRQDNVFAQWVKADREENVGVQYQKGLYRRGHEKPADFITMASGLLRRAHLSDSEMNAIAAISENEGYLDAVNTWDSQYISFGLFQWTLGYPDRAGELGALLTRLKQTYPNEFEYYFGQFGLDVEDSDGIRGWLSLNAVRLKSDYQKSLLRQPIWAYRFAIAGRDVAIKSAQILHAIDRLDRFYFIRHSGLGDYSLSDLVQSEFGVTLLLDNHVNRPAYVAPGIAEAMAELNLQPENLANGSTETELRLLERYLTVRETFGSKPMTHAKTRGERISRQVRLGKLSQERGSFVSNRDARMG